MWATPSSLDGLKMETPIEMDDVGGVAPFQDTSKRLQLANVKKTIFPFLFHAYINDLAGPFSKSM